MTLEVLEARLVPATLTVNSIADTVSASAATLDLREAIQLINTGGTATDGSGNSLSAAKASQIDTTQPYGTNDTIVFDSGLNGQTITLGGSALEISADVIITGLGASNLTVSGNNASTVFTIDTNVNATIQGLTIIEGNGAYGGGIANNGTTTVNDCTIRGNIASSEGGGIDNNGTLTVSNTTFSNNSVLEFGQGGAIENDGTLTVTSTIFSDNSACSGGAIENGGPLTVTDSLFTGNVAVPVVYQGGGSNGGGGGGIDNYSMVILSNSTFSDNSGLFGGGIQNDGTLTVTNSTFSDNVVNDGAGGGIENSGTLTVTNSTVSNNSAATAGGINSGGTLTITNSTISGNTASDDVGGIYASDCTLQNTIVAGNTALNGEQDIYGDTFTANYSMIGDTNGAVITGSNNILNPSYLGLGTLGNYGGLTQTIPLLAGSPAIDAGSNSLAVDANGNPLTTDQRGDPRIIGSSVDIGAYESLAYYPTLTASASPSTIALGITSLPTLDDSATLSGGYYETGTLTFTLSYNGGSTPLDTETVAVNGDGTYTTPTGYTLPTTGMVAGTYTWSVSYGGDSNNNPAVDEGGTSQQTVVSSKVTPILTTSHSPTSITLGSTPQTLTESATLVNGNNETGTITFTLVAPNGSIVDSETVEVNGDGTYTTPNGYTLPTSGTVAGTYTWQVNYSGDNNNYGATPTGIVTVSSFNGSNGYAPNGLVEDTYGDLFGTTLGGGSNYAGSVFEIAAGSNTITTLASFDGSNGSPSPNGIVVDSNGNLFGTTEYGGANGDGMVYEVVAGSGTITVLASFDGTNGANPDSGLIEDSKGNLFGTAVSGGLKNYGTVFEVAAGSGTITPLASFDGYDDSSYPYGGLVEDSAGNLFGITYYGSVYEVAAGSGIISPLAYSYNENAATLIEDSNGNLFGTTAYGGASNDGSVYELAAGSGTITTIASFNGSNGEVPYFDLVEDGSGDLFGTTGAGGLYGNGTVFEVAAGSGTITTLANINQGGYIAGSLVEDGSGHLFGIMQHSGEYGDGSVFEVTTNTVDSVTVNLASPTITTTPNPTSIALGSTSPTLRASATLSGGYFETGTITFALYYNGDSTSLDTETVSVNGDGTYTTPTGYQLPTTSTVVGTYTWQVSYSGDGNNNSALARTDEPTNVGIVAFFNQDNGASPRGGLITDSSGNLFGTTAFGGAFGLGTVYEVNANSGSLTTLASFNASNEGGYYPIGGLVEDSVGNLFGTTDEGGVNNVGTVFELSAGSGTITTLASFDTSNGVYPHTALVEDSNGDLFGTTQQGGANNLGTVFELKANSGSITPLVSFSTSNEDGYYPQAGLYEDSDGNLFGTTSLGGLYGGGTLFEVASASGAITLLASFNGNHGGGDVPSGPLIEDGNGNLFGTTEFGGAFGGGTVFEVNANSGSITTLASFNSYNPANGGGYFPTTGVIEDSSGNLFGTTLTGGAYGDGTVYEVAAGSGFITPIVDFDFPNGTEPDDNVSNAGLVENSNGDLFGTTASSGGAEYGTLFEVTASEVAAADAEGKVSKATPTMTTTPNPTSIALGSTPTTLRDSATLSGGYYETGTITFTLYYNGGNTPLDTETVAVNGNGTYTTPTGYLLPTNGTVAGTYTWQTRYSGDGNNNGATPTGIVTIASFNGTNGGTPTGLIEDRYGNLFGTTDGGGSNNAGTVFEVAAGSGTITTLASFDGSNGSRPGGIVEDSKGNLFGTAAGGANGDGLVYEVAAGSGVITDLASFDGSNGANPASNLVVDSNGNLFGTTVIGGLNNEGTVFEVMAGSGSITPLASFDGSNGSYPYGGLVEDSAGNLFGVSYGGTIYEVAVGSGIITPLASAYGGNAANLIEDGNGNLFGTSAYGGSYGDGSVYELAAGSDTITTLASFNGSNGEVPYFGLVEDGSGNLFGATADGGAYGNGTVFKVAAGSGTITTLANVNQGGYIAGSLVEDGSGNLFGIMQGSSGEYGRGSVFEVTTNTVDSVTVNAASPTLTTTPTPTSITLGSMRPTLTASATLSGGYSETGTITFTLYYNGGNTSLDTETVSVNGDGTYTTPTGYQLPTTSTVTGTYTWQASYSGDGNNNSALARTDEPTNLVTVAYFNGIENSGNDPQGGLITDSSGNLFGTTTFGGAFGTGTVYEVKANSGSITTLASFNSSNGSGYYPESGLIEDSDGNLFGTTLEGGVNGVGTVFELAAGSGTITTLASFDTSNGNYPQTALVEDSSGDLFGTTQQGGANNLGTVYEVKANSGSITPLVSFSSSNDAGYTPGAGLYADSDGNLFGTTIAGGLYGYGSVFEVASASGTITTLAYFDGQGVGGAVPHGSLIEDSNGNLFGTTEIGGAFGPGTVFEVKANSGSITTLASFSANNGGGEYPTTGLIEDSSGNLFGTTQNGGADGDGTVYEVAAGSGFITPLVNFDLTNGAYPENAGLVEDSNGDLFGTTIASSGFGGATLFEVTASEVAAAAAEGKVSQASPTLTVSPSASTIALGTTSPTLDDSATLSGGYYETGSLTFTLYYNGGSTPLDTETVAVNGDGTYTTPTGYTLPGLPPSGTAPSKIGTYQWDVSYSGDGNNNAASDIGNPNNQVSISKTNPTLVTSPNSITLGNTDPTLGNSVTLSGIYFDPNTITLSLYNPNNQVVDTETVDISANGTYTTPTGYTLPTTGTVTGTYYWEDSYGGDANNNPASTNPSQGAFTVNAASPSIVATASGNITLGTTDPTISDSAVLSGGYYETGSLVFTLKLGSTIVYSTSDTLTGNSTYTANYTLPTTGTVAGTYTWSVSYAGDGNNNAAVDQGGTTQQTVVSPASTSGTVTASINPSVFGQPVTFTATVTSNSSWASPPTGMVTFMEGSTNLGTGTLNGVSGNDQATLTTSLLGAGTQNITAVYAGGGNFLGSTTSPLSQVVSATPLLENGVLAIPGTTSAATITLTPTLPSGASTYSMKVTRTIGTTTTTLGTFAVPTGIVQVYGGPGTATVILNGTSSTDVFTGFNGTVSEVAAQNTAQATSFTVGLTAVTALTLNGSGGTDSLTGPNQANTWTITGSNAGTLNSTTTFTGIANLTGGTVQDTFKFLHGGSLSGNLIGEAPTNTLDDSNYGSPVTINLQTTKATAISGTWTNLQTLIGTGITDTLVGANTTNTWSINGANAGTVGAYSFSAFPNLTGGSGNDRFAFLPGGSITGNLNGGSGTNTLDDSGYGSAVTVYLQTTKASGIGGIFSSIQSLIGTGTTDMLIGANSTNSWSIIGSNAGTVGSYSFSAFPDLTGGTGNDTFKFVSPSTLSGTLNGGGGNDTITGDNNGDTFTISGNNAGSIASILTGGFSNIENLTGGSGNDRFSFLPGGLIAGNLNGGSGTNTLDDSGYGSGVTVNLQTTKATGIGGTFASIQVINGTNTTDTLIGSNSNSTWSLTGANAGTAGSITFAGFANLTGGTGNDTFKLTPTASVSGTIDGGAGSNTLVGANISNTWDVTGSNAGTLNTTLTFADIQNLTGGTAGNTFSILHGGSVTGTVNGTASTGNTLDYSLYASPVTVNLQTKTGTALGSAWSNIQSLKGTNTTDTLIGSNSNSTWSLTGANAGTAGSITFAGFSNLTGGTGNDTFKLTPTASVTGTIDGGAGSNTLVGANISNTWDVTGTNAGTLNTTLLFADIQNLTGGTAGNTFSIVHGGSVAGIVNGTSSTGNTLDYSLYASPVTVNLQTKTGTAIGGTWSNIQSFKGTNTTDTLTGPNSTSTWTLTGTNAGTVSNLTFAGFANLTGGSSGNDTFSFSNGAGVTGVITGGGGTNTLNYSLYTTGIIADLQTLTATGTGGIANIQNITGGHGNDILVGNASANVLSESSTKTAADLLIGGGGADVVTAGGGGDILIDGSTDYDTTVAALNALLQAWEGSGSYATRVQTLQSGVSYTNGNGTTQTAQLTTSTINTNPNASKSTLNGGSGADVFFASFGDTINNKTYSAPGNSHTPKTIITI